MKWTLEANRPIYPQLLEQLQMGVISGIYKPGEKLPSVRELAAEAGVNPNTMQRALAELERNGLVRTQRTTGRFITEDYSMIEELKRNIALANITDFLNRMEQLGYRREEILQMIESIGDYSEVTDEKNAAIL